MVQQDAAFGISVGRGGVSLAWHAGGGGVTRECRGHMGMYSQVSG